jgi:hypothetical protein
MVVVVLLKVKTLFFFGLLFATFYIIAIVFVIFLSF